MSKLGSQAYLPWFSVLLIVFALGWYVGHRDTVIAHAQFGGAPRLVAAPKAWGAFKGASGGGGYIFEDSDGTLRTLGPDGVLAQQVARK
jgi:hypothetical protein